MNFYIKDYDISYMNSVNTRFVDCLAFPVITYSYPSGSLLYNLCRFPIFSNGILEYHQKVLQACDSLLQIPFNQLFLVQFSEAIQKRRSNYITAYQLFKGVNIYSIN
jgi:hypothetical protein